MPRQPRSRPTSMRLPLSPLQASTYRGRGTVNLSIRRELLAREREFYDGARELQDDLFNDKWQKTQHRLSEALQAGLLTKDTIELARNVVLRLSVMQKTFDEVDTITAGICQTAFAEMLPPQRGASLRSKRCKSSTDLSASSPPLSSPSPSTKTLALRQHPLPCIEFFLSHLSHPYPTAADRAHLLALLPPSYNHEKVKTWFGNTRRRSGWRKGLSPGTAEHSAVLTYFEKLKLGGNTGLGDGRAHGEVDEEALAAAFEPEPDVPNELLHDISPHRMDIIPPTASPGPAEKSFSALLAELSSEQLVPPSLDFQTLAPPSSWNHFLHSLALTSSPEQPESWDSSLWGSSWDSGIHSIGETGWLCA